MHRVEAREQRSSNTTARQKYSWVLRLKHWLELVPTFRFSQNCSNFYASIPQREKNAEQYVAYVRSHWKGAAAFQVWFHFIKINNTSDKCTTCKTIQRCCTAVLSLVVSDWTGFLAEQLRQHNAQHIFSKASPHRPQRRRFCKWALRASDIKLRSKDIMKSDILSWIGLKLHQHKWSANIAWQPCVSHRDAQKTRLSSGFSKSAPGRVLI